MSTVALFARAVRVPSSAKSLPEATREPSTVEIFAEKALESAAKVPVTSQ